MDGVGSVSFIRWNGSERRNVRVRDDVSVQKERWVWYDYSSQWRETLFMYLSERSDFEWLWFHIESLSSSSFISFWEIPNDESKSLTRWNCDEKCDRIRSSDRSGYHIVSKIFDFFGIGDIIWFHSGWIIFEYVIMDVRMRSNDMEICTHSSFKPYELAHQTHRHLW